MNQLSIFDRVQFADTSETFISDIESFCEFGQKTVVDTQDGIPYFVNEFWTAGQLSLIHISEPTRPY